MSAPPAEHLVDPAWAARLVAAELPQLGPVRVEPLGWGWDCTVHTVIAADGRCLAVRFPRREAVVAGFRRELAVLPLLGPRLPLPVPVPLHVGRPNGAYPWPFAASVLIDGVELAESGLPDADRVPAAAALGGFLRALHDPSLLTDPVLAALPPDANSRADMARRVPMARDAADALVRRGLWRADPAVRGLMDRAARLRPTKRPLVVAHGDLHARQVLVDGDGRASGVIDWVDVCRADPAVDLLLAYGAFDGPARAAFLGAYGPVGRDAEIRARLLAVFLAGVLAGHAADDGREALLAESLAGLRRAVAP